MQGPGAQNSCEGSPSLQRPDGGSSTSDMCVRIPVPGSHSCDIYLHGKGACRRDGHHGHVTAQTGELRVVHESRAVWPSAFPNKRHHWPWVSTCCLRKDLVSLPAFMDFLCMPPPRPCQVACVYEKQSGSVQPTRTALSCKHSAHMARRTQHPARVYSVGFGVSVGVAIQKTRDTASQ